LERIFIIRLVSHRPGYRRYIALLVQIFGE